MSASFSRASTRLHGLLQHLAYAGWPVLRRGGAHYRVAARNPEFRGSAVVPAPRTVEPVHQESHDVFTPVVILGANTHVSLGIMRSLGRMGVPVHAVCSPPRDPASCSAYCKSTALWDFAHAKPEDTVSFLLELAQRIGTRSILIPTWDEMAVFTPEYYHSLKPWFICPEQSGQLA